jgi:hypothetical protein
MPDTLVLLARINVQVSASNVSTTMTVKTHQQQVFSQVSPVLDFKFMSFPFSAKANFSTDIYILVGIWWYLYEENHLLAPYDSGVVMVSDRPTPAVPEKKKGDPKAAV